MNTSVLRTNCALASLVGWLGAQDLRPVDAPNLSYTFGCFDATRGRLVLVGTAHDTWEWDGTSWLRRPFLGPPTYEKVLVHDPLRRAIYCLSYGAPGTPLAMWRGDGSSWSAMTPLVPFLPRSQMALAFDSARGEVVMFGGADTWSTSDLAETWAFDGTTWTQRLPAASPPARHAAAMACDSIRQRLVLFGGNTQNGLLQDTWEWDGGNWHARQTTTRPSARMATVMAFDPVRARCVLFGGLDMSANGDTWEYDGIDWSLVIPAGSAPAARWWTHAMAFDDRLQEVVLTGGYTGGPIGSLAHDHWSWNGTRWQPVSDRGPKPAARLSTSLVGEPGGSSVLLFGGEDNWRTYADTWRWDGRTWAELPAAGPPARTAAAMFRHQNSVCLFGGVTGLGPLTMFGDTWSWNGASWAQLAPAQAPSPRAHAGVASDVANQVAVLFGGWNGTPLGDTWTFDGATWHQHSPVPAPGPRVGHAMAYDPWRSATVLFGGEDPAIGMLADTWQWNGSTWQQQNPVHRPPGGQATMDFDVTRQQLVLVSSATGSATAWQYDGVDWQPIALAEPRLLGYGARLATAPNWRGVVVFGSGNLFELAPTPALAVEYGIACGVAAPRLSASTWPSPGAAFGLDATGNDPGSLVAFVGAVSAVNMPIGSCSLLVTPGQMLVLSLGNAHGFAHLGLPLPNNSTYLGVDLFFQCASLRASAPTGFVMSRGLQITIGD